MTTAPGVKEETVEQAQLPESGQETPERRRGERRAEDRGRARMSNVQAAVWAVCGAVVVLYIFFVAIGGVNPTRARVTSIVVLVLALLYVIHSWRRLVSGGHVSRPDRERRGF